MTLTDIRIKINKLSHKNKFIVGSKPEFESSQQNHPFEHIRNCPTYEYSTDILSRNILMTTSISLSIPSFQPMHNYVQN